MVVPGTGGPSIPAGTNTVPQDGPALVAWMVCFTVWPSISAVESAGCPRRSVAAVTRTASFHSNSADATSCVSIAGRVIVPLKFKDAV